MQETWSSARKDRASGAQAESGHGKVAQASEADLGAAEGTCTEPATKATL